MVKFFFFFKRPLEVPQVHELLTTLMVLIIILTQIRCTLIFCSFDYNTDILCLYF